MTRAEGGGYRQLPSDVILEILSFEQRDFCKSSSCSVDDSARQLVGRFQSDSTRTPYLLFTTLFVEFEDLKPEMLDGMSRLVWKQVRRVQFNARGRAATVGFHVQREQKAIPVLQFFKQFQKQHDKGCFPNLQAISLITNSWVYDHSFFSRRMVALVQSIATNYSTEGIPFGKKCKLSSLQRYRMQSESIDVQNQYIPFEQLRLLELDSIAVTVPIKFLVDKCPNLKTLLLQDSKVSERYYDKLGDLKQVRCLGLELGDEAEEMPPVLPPTLQRLELRVKSIPQNFEKVISASRNLRSIVVSLDWSDCDRDALSTLARVKPSIDLVLHSWRREVSNIDQTAVNFKDLITSSNLQSISLPRLIEDREGEMYCGSGGHAWTQHDFRNMGIGAQAQGLLEISISGELTNDCLLLLLEVPKLRRVSIGRYYNNNVAADVVQALEDRGIDVIWLP